MLTVVLALMASVSWGTSDFLAGLRSRRLPLLTVLWVSQAAGLVSISALVAARGQGPPEGGPVVYAALAGVAGTVGITALYRGLAVGAMSIVAPISATSAVVPVAVGLATGERPTLPQGLGIAFAMIGVVLASRAAGDQKSERSVAAGVGLACVAALAFGLLLVALDAASRGDALWGTLILRATALGLLASAALAVRPSLSLGRRDLMILLVVGVLDTGANALFAIAATRGLLSLVSVLAQLYPVVTVLLARFVIGERVGRIQQLGVIAAFTGAGLITVG